MGKKNQLITAIMMISPNNYTSTFQISYEYNKSNNNNYSKV